MPRKQSGKFKDEDDDTLGRPQGAPRGLLLYYILHKVSQKPVHGYEILQDIESKTEGAWRPGPGSIYPMMKKLVLKGYISSDEKKASGESAFKSYHITPKGTKCLAKVREEFANAGQKWSATRRIFIDMVGPEHMAKFFVEGARLHFDTSRELLNSRLPALSESEAQYILKEYALNLERQLDWTREKLGQIERVRKQKAVSVTV